MCQVTSCRELEWNSSRQCGITETTRRKKHNSWLDLCKASVWTGSRTVRTFSTTNFIQHLQKLTAAACQTKQCWFASPQIKRVVTKLAEPLCQPSFFSSTAGKNARRSNTIIKINHDVVSAEFAFAEVDCLFYSISVFLKGYSTDVMSTAVLFKRGERQFRLISVSEGTLSFSH